MSYRDEIENMARTMLTEHPGMPRLWARVDGGERVYFTISWQRAPSGMWRGQASSKTRGWVVEVELHPEQLTDFQRRHLEWLELTT